MALGLGIHRCSTESRSAAQRGVSSAFSYKVWARSSETATFRIRHGLHLLYAAVLSAQLLGKRSQRDDHGMAEVLRSDTDTLRRRCLLQAGSFVCRNFRTSHGGFLQAISSLITLSRQATRCLLGSSKDTVLVALTDAASAQSDRTYKRRRSVVDRFVVGHLPARRRVLELALRAWRDVSCTYQTYGNQTGRQPSALQSKAGAFSHDEIRKRVCESKPKTKASIPTMLCGPLFPTIVKENHAQFLL